MKLLLILFVKKSGRAGFIMPTEYLKDRLN